MAKVRAPIVEATGLQSTEARRLVDDSNRLIREAFRDISSDQELDDSEAVLALTELEVHSQRVAVQALRLELEHVQSELQEVYSARGARVVHVRRDSTGNVVQLVAVGASAA